MLPRTAFFFAIFLLYIFASARCVLLRTLNEQWVLKGTEKELLTLNVTVPGGIYTDLYKNGIIDDVFYGSNDVATRWISTNDWLYEKTFNVDGDVLNCEHINVVFYGIDTFASITVNEVVVGKTENMFRKYIFDVKPILKGQEENKISVYFSSPVNRARELFEQQSLNYSVPPNCVPTQYNGECHVNHIRKMQASFGWDWGPAFPSMGIWKPVEIQAYNSSIVTDITVDTAKNVSTGMWDVNIVLYFEGILNASNTNIVITLQTEASELKQSFELNDLKIDTNGDVFQRVSIFVPQSDVEMWWPNGYGKSPTYPLNTTLIHDSGETQTKVIYIGFRTVELIENEVGDGLSFYFLINDVPIYMKGSNLIPTSILPERISDVRYLLQSAKDVHMNMLRVWGGGFYQSDEFYQIADEMGLLIWQDFMFACSMYPVNEEFLNNVRIEVNQQVKRLQHHASIALWAANNENEVAIDQNWYGTKNEVQYKQDYEALYVNIIKNETIRLDQSRPFVLSSPSNGPHSISSDYAISQNPQNPLFGDVHYYNDLFDGWHIAIYPISRFTSEYGYQSLPAIGTLLTATNNLTDLITNSSFLEHRQHKLMASYFMQIGIEYQLSLPDSNIEHYAEMYVYFSQIIQAQSTKIETEYYRSWRNRTNSAGQGMNMGALYWQLNDVWAAPTWSSIDFLGKWKMLHYFAKNFFSPIIVTGYIEEDDTFNLFTVSDLVTDVKNATLTLTVYLWHSMLALSENTIHVDIPASSSMLILSMDIATVLPNRCGDKENAKLNCFIYITLTDAYNIEIAPDNYIFPLPLNQIDLPTPNIAVEIESVDSAKTFSITVKTDEISLFVWLEVPEIPGKFSENGFLQVEPEKQLIFYSDFNISSAELKNALTVVNLRNEKFL